MLVQNVKNSHNSFLIVSFGENEKNENLDFSFKRTFNTLRIRNKFVVVFVAICMLSDQWTVTVVKGKQVK